MHACLHLDVGLCACVCSNVDVGLGVSSHSLKDFPVNLLSAFLMDKRKKRGILLSTPLHKSRLLVLASAAVLSGNR